MSYKNMKARKRFMAIALSGAMMLSVTGCGSNRRCTDIREPGDHE